MVHKRCIAAVLFVAMLMGSMVFAGGTVKVSAAVPMSGIKWDQAVVDVAVKQSVGTMDIDPDFKWASTLHLSEIIYFLALASYYDPNLTSTSGVKVSDRLVNHITYLTSGGKEPASRGALGGWIDNPIAQAFVLAKHTPAVWNELNKKDREKCDFIMKYMAVSNNYMQNYANNPSRDLSQTYEYNKTWNPNMQEGNVHAMAAAYIYFGGADEVNKILAGFDYDQYIAKMDEYNFTNVKRYFELTGKELLENGGAGTKGAKIPFTYMDVLTREEVPFEPYALFRSTALKQFSHIVQSVVSDGQGRIADNSVSPYEGRMGMCYEFNSLDAGGLRTSADYVSFSMRNTIPTRATLEALEYWKGDDIRDIEERMYVGVGDFLYKVSSEHGGYIGHQKGNNTHDIETASNFQSVGYQFYKEVWQKALKSDYHADYTISGSGQNTEASVSFSNYLLADIPVKIIVAVCDGNNKLTGVTTKDISVGSKGGKEEIAVNTQKDSKIKVFVYDSAKGMQQLTAATEM